MLKSMSAPYCPPSVQRAPTTSSCPPIDVLSALPDDLLLKVALRLPPLDRLQLQRVCRRFQRVLAEWPDIASLEVVALKEIKPASPKASRLPFALTPRPPPQRLEVRLTDAHGQTDPLRTSEGHRNPAKLLKTLMSRFQLVQLTINDCALGSEFASTVAKQETLKTLRLWNCSDYFVGEKKNKQRSLVQTLVGLEVESLLVLDSHINSGATCKATFDRGLAECTSRSIRSLQLTGLHLPLESLETLAARLANSCTRLAIGCTFCEETKRIDYINALRKFHSVNDLDLPPSIFLLRQLEVPDAVIQRLFDELPLRALGFRHKNSSVLFRFIERHLPMKIRVLRVHHSASRIPNFSSLGQTSAEKKTSVVSSSSVLSRSSMGSYSGITVACDAARVSDQQSSCSEAGSSVDPTVASSLAARQLTIFSLAERSRPSQNPRLKQRNHCGVTVYYLRNFEVLQEIFGRLTPISSPHLYIRNPTSKISVFNGDIVKTNALDRLGFESESEVSESEI